MPPLPQLIEEDVRRIDAVLQEFLARSEAETVLVTAEGGFVIFQSGNTSEFDVTSLGALASNAFNANQAIASIITEPNFNSLYQQGDKFSLLVESIDSFHHLIVILPAKLSVGLVKYYAAAAVGPIADQLRQARDRAPGEGLDPAMLNLADSTTLFKKSEP